MARYKSRATRFHNMEGEKSARGTSVLILVPFSVANDASFPLPSAQKIRWLLYRWDSWRRQIIAHNTAAAALPTESFFLRSFVDSELKEWLEPVFNLTVRVIETDECTPPLSSLKASSFSLETLGGTWGHERDSLGKLVFQRIYGMSGVSFRLGF